MSQSGAAVRYVASGHISEERSSLGWEIPEKGDVEVVLATDRDMIAGLIDSSPLDSIHVTQGVRGNGIISFAQKLMAERKMRLWVFMETVDDTSWWGFLKRLEYARLFRLIGSALHGVLAIGHSTPGWIEGVGVDRGKIYPFAYFMREPSETVLDVERGQALKRLLYVGQFVRRKRVDMLIDAVSTMTELDVELAVVGTGPLEEELRSTGLKSLGDRLVWLGVRKNEDVCHEMRRSDCLVLPSSFDGWGTVVSEAMLVGTPAVVSHRCGSAGIVRASGHGAVFRSGDVASLTERIISVIGRYDADPSKRLGLMKWSQRLGSRMGASYLFDILDHVYLGKPRPQPLWTQT